MRSRFTASFGTSFASFVMAALFVVLAAGASVAQFGPGGPVVFDNGTNALGIPFELNSDKMYLQVKINNSGPYWLVLDTGSPGMILDTQVAKELAISTGDGIEAGGAGENPFVVAPADSTFDAKLPGITLLSQPAMIGGIDAVVGPFEGRRIDGVLGGYNLFGQFQFKCFIIVLLKLINPEINIFSCWRCNLASQLATS